MYHSKQCQRREVGGKKRETTGARVNYGKWQIVQTQHTVHTHTHSHRTTFVWAIYFLYCALCCYCLVYMYIPATLCLAIGALVHNNHRKCRCEYNILNALCKAHAARLFAFDISSILFQCFAMGRNGATPHTKKSRNKNRKKQQQQQRNKFHYEWNMFASNMKCAALQQPQHQLFQQHKKFEHTHTGSKHFQ